VMIHSMNCTRDALASCVKFGIANADDNLNSVNASAAASGVQHAVFSGTKKRVPSLSKKFDDSVVLTSVGHRGMRATEDQRETDAFGFGCRDSLRRAMFDILDRMQSELKARFSNSKPILLSCDTLNPNTSVFLDYDVMKPLADAFSYLGIDASKLQFQCVVAKHMFASGIETETMESVFKKLIDLKCAFADLVKFAQLVFTVPVSSAGAERSFSTMKRVKTYLRSTMGDTRLTHLCILSIERALSGQLLTDPSIVVDAFAKCGNRRLSMVE
jgi:hypothetical protein